MSANSRFTVAVHILAWMALAVRDDHHVVTSEQIAASVNTNPVVIRRILGQLRDAGLVTVQRGNGAGWSLAHPAESISLAQVYDALEPERMFAMHASEPSQRCLVGRGIQSALNAVYGGVEQAVRDELRNTTVADALAQSLASS